MFKPIKIRHYLKLLAQRQIAPERVLQGTGLSVERLQDASCLLAFEQIQTVVTNMIDLSGDQGIGLEIGAQTDLVDLGLVGHAMRASATLRDATECWIRYGEALVGMLVRVELENPDSVDWSLRIRESFPMGFIYNFCVEECLMMISKLADQIVQGEPVPSVRRLELSYPAPAHHALYARYFSCPVQFNARATRIVFDNLSLDQPLRGFDGETHGIISRQCRLALRKINMASPCAARVRSILERMPAQLPGIGQVADELHLSERTLRRRLASEGCSFQGLVNELRTDLACDYLSATELSAKEVGFLLGFEDANSFYRAFRHWTGQSVEAYRQGSLSG